MNKKILLTLLSAIMIVSFAAACGENPETSTELESVISSDVSSIDAETQSEESTEKEKHEDIDGYEYGDFDKFNSYAEENGLENTAIYIQGTVKNVSDLISDSENPLCNLSIATGEKEGWLAIFALVPYSENINTLLDGKEVTCFGKYLGWSDVMLKPSMLIDKIIVDGKEYTTEDIANISKESSTEIDTETEKKKTEESTDKANSNSSEPSTEVKSELPVENTEKIIFDNNGIKITYKGIESDWIGQVVKLKIENTSEKDYTVQVRDVSVNGYMIDPIFSCDIKSGKTANDKISFLESDFEENNIEKIDNIELYFHVFNYDDWDDDFDST